MSEYLDLLPKEDAAIIRKALSILQKRLKRKDVCFTQPELVKTYLRMHLQGGVREVFQVLFLDSQHRLIESKSLFYGTIDASPVFPRVVVQEALRHNAAATILAHNHPSGVGEPSRADRAITERLQAALRLVDIKVLDHFVIGDEEIISFAERGWL
jgi:DNA repair protein RadC